MTSSYDVTNHCIDVTNHLYDVTNHCIDVTNHCCDVTNHYFDVIVGLSPLQDLRFCPQIPVSPALALAVGKLNLSLFGNKKYNTINKQNLVS